MCKKACQSAPNHRLQATWPSLRFGQAPEADRRAAVTRAIGWSGFCGLALVLYSGSASAGACEVRPSYDATRGPLPLSLRTSVRPGMRVAEILAALGPAHEDLCSGLYCPMWHLADGSQIVVRFSDPCGTPLAVEVKPAVRSK